MLARFKVSGFALVLIGLASLVPAVARAGNGTHPRTPVLWEPEPACLTVVDRTIDAKLAFNYTIPYEDLRPENAIDEVDDSRRHQFIGFCRWHSPQQPLGGWLSAADVDLATAAGVVDMDSVEPEDILEQNPDWQQCFTRITGDAERRLITFAEAGKPVMWDTTGLAAGPYVISGYTWEPQFNIWSVRPGVVKVMDDPDPSKNGPMLAILNRNEIVFAEDVLTIAGCLDAMDGSTITGSWALTNDDTLDVLEWTSFAADVPVSGDSFELPFAPPQPTVGESIVIKIEIVDPMDRSYTAHMLDLVDVLPGGESGDCSDSSMNFIGMPDCPGGSSGGSSGGESDAPTGTSGATTMTTTMTTMTTMTMTTSATDGGASEASGMLEPGDGGCGCAQGGGGGPALLLGSWLLWTARRRRSARTCEVDAKLTRS